MGVMDKFLNYMKVCGEDDSWLEALFSDDSEQDIAAVGTGWSSDMDKAPREALMKADDATMIAGAMADCIEEPGSGSQACHSGKCMVDEDFH